MSGIQIMLPQRFVNVFIGISVLCIITSSFYLAPCVGTLGFSTDYFS